MVQLRRSQLFQEGHDTNDEIGVRLGCVSSQFFQSRIILFVLIQKLGRMQACFVNTSHPDFLNGHKVRTLLV
jgi:hypothetical protein